jgi:hypothetical protein
MVATHAEERHGGSDERASTSMSDASTLSRDWHDRNV